MTMPERIQHKRSKGWRMPPNTISVKRPGFWGNWICVGDPGRLWIKTWHEGGLQTTLTADLPEPVDQARAVAVHRYWLDTDNHSAMAASLGRAWMIPGFEKLDQNFQALAERELMLKRRDTLARLPELKSKNLACTCELGIPCHADVLLELANK